MKRPRLAIPVIGGPHWLGGWNYMLNLVRVMAEFAPGEVDILLFAGSDLDPGALAELRALPEVTLVQDAMFDPKPASRRLARAVVTGVDRPALDLFRRHGVNVVFEAARFFGRRFPLPAIAWFPDFQHRRLPHLFPRRGRWRREIGFRAQIATGRLIMLSSAAAEADCLSFYPQARGRTRVVRFAVPADDGISVAEAQERARALGLPQRFFFLPNQLWIHKNHAIAIDAARLLRSAGDESVIAATGHGDDPRAPGHVERLYEKVKASGLERQFRFLGRISYNDVRALGLVAAAVVNPSRFEGWSTTVEEAIAAGTPLILSDLAVHREQGGPEARYFEVDDAERLAELISATPTRDHQVIAADRARAAHLNSERRARFAHAFAAVAHEAAAMPFSSPTGKIRG